MRQIELDFRCARVRCPGAHDTGGLQPGVRRERAYFVTGDVSTGAYAEDCYFADPTVAFSGLARWQNNLVLLVPFLISPRIDLEGLEQTGPGTLQARLGPDRRLGSAVCMHHVPGAHAQHCSPSGTAIRR